MTQSAKSKRIYWGKKPVALLLGAGYTAQFLAPILTRKGYKVIGTAREAKALNFPVIPFQRSASDDLFKALDRAEIILSSVPPSGDGHDPILAALPNIAQLAPNCRWAGYLSATSVYGDRQGQWAFEDELLRPVTQRGHNRVEAELAWLESDLPVHIFRLAGIYGPHVNGRARNPLTRVKSGKARAVIKPDHVVNRIHVEDIASAVLASIEAPDAGQVYNIADGHPCPPQDVLDFAARMLGTKLPMRVDYTTADISDMARSFYKETKRVDISRAQKRLNWQPRHDTYRKGLMSIYREAHNLGRAVLLGGYIDVPETHRPRIVQALETHIRLSNAEPGCIHFQVEQDENRLTRFHVFEIFKDAKSFMAHQTRTQASEWGELTRGMTRDYDVVGLK